MTRCSVVDDRINELRDAGVAGSLAYRERMDGTMGGIAFICPCGCGREGYLPMKGNGHPQEWSWDGNRDSPTVTPSVQFVGGCRWHGWLRAGEWVSC